MMTFEKAWQAYETYYAPKTPLATIETQFATSLLDIHEQFDVLLLDGFGVLNVGTQSIPEMPEIIAQLQKMGKHTFVLTNGASQKNDILCLKYPKLGYQFSPSHIISSRQDALHYLQSHPELLQKLWGVIAMPDCQIEEFPMPCKRINEGNFDEVDAFIFLGTTGWDSEKQAALIASLQKNPRLVLIANPDMSAPLQDAFSYEPGTFANDLEGITQVLRFGKPFPSMYDLALEKVKTLTGIDNKDRILMVGDTLHTDILGGRQAGIKTALMTDWGFFRNKDVQPYIQKSGISPHFIISNK